MNPGTDKDDPGNKGAMQRTSDDLRRNIAIVDHQIDSRDLFVSGREITIAHGSDVCRLRLTAQNKLILTK